MSSEKPSPKITTKARQDRDKLEYERLVAELKHVLEHKSPGLFGWLDDTVGIISGAVESAVDWTNNLVDTYLWDSDQDEAVVESWVRDTFNIPDQQGKGFISEAVDKVNDVVDTYIWATGASEAKVEQWVRDTFDIPDEDGKGFVEEAGKAIIDVVKPYVEPVTEVVTKITEKITTTVKETVDQVGDIINNIALTLGVGFDAAMAALGGLPGMLTQWRDDLAGWFEIDVDELIGKVKATMGEIKPEGEL